MGFSGCQVTLLTERLVSWGSLRIMKRPLLEKHEGLGVHVLDSMVSGFSGEVVLEQIDLVVLEYAVLRHGYAFLNAHREVRIAVQLLAPLARFIGLLVVDFLGPATLLVLHAAVGRGHSVGVNLR